MKLIPKFIKISNIQIDPFNPRFVESTSYDQEIILRNLLKKKYVKELLRSMQVDIKWVNRIVVRELKNHDKEEKLDISNGKYVVVEGNTRMACLKSGLINGIDENYEVPILLASKEKTETKDQFLKQIKITQGIANVTVVKEWDPLSKAKHLHSLYTGYKEENSSKSPNQIYKIIADELGKSIHEIRQAIIRFTIYSKISEVSDTIPEERFAYIEAFEKNKETRALIGMDSETNEFDLDEEEDLYELEILEKIPALIKEATSKGVNTKQFRDIIHKKMISYAKSEKLNELVNAILDEENNITFHSLMNEVENTDLKAYWATKIKQLEEEIGSYPIAEDWSNQNKTVLESINKKLNKIIKAL